MDEAGMARWSWSRLVWKGPLAFGILFLVLMVAVAQEFEPFIFIIAVITLIAGYVGRRFPGRAGPITVLVVMSLLVLLNLGPIIEDLGHPESFVNFALFGVVALTFAFVGIIASIAVLRSLADTRAPTLFYAAVGVIVLAIVVSGFAALSLEDDLIVSGDLRLVAEDVEFSPATLTGSGPVGIFVDNKDPIRHTFTIKSLDLEVELPANTSRRVDITAAPGTYDFLCTVEGHDDMKGTLTISG